MRARAGACEAVHAQLNLPDHRLAVANTTGSDRPRLTLRSRVLSIDSRMLAERIDSIDAKANSVVTLAAPLDLTAALSRARDVNQEVDVRGGEP